MIYQLLPRLFGNTRPPGRRGGTIAESGCGKFSRLNDRALLALKEFGATHLWLTGVLEQASGTDHPGRPADPPELLKGTAGSPYAIRDYFDICPDYAEDPARRLDEFCSLLARCGDHGLKVLIDFVPNHVARTYRSDVRPDASLGDADDPTRFFARDNHFYYVQPDQAEGGPPLKLPVAGNPGQHGTLETERAFVRVTGNNAICFAPRDSDWYETVKLNYGHDFTRGRDTSHLPAATAPPSEVPDLWRKMDDVMDWWQSLGVAGFRVDMAHMVPMEFWNWLIRRARARDENVYIFGEAYDSDPMKLCDGNVLHALLEAGFDAVYDSHAYDLCKGLFDGVQWANDFDQLQFAGPLFHRSLRYAENHDEVRLAYPGAWGGRGMHVGRPASAVLFGMGRGPVMIYHGQEVGEPAEEGNGRTSIFDYGTIPELQKWVNDGAFDGGGLGREQRELRDWYRRLLRVVSLPAFSEGDFYGLNHANKTNPSFGRFEGEEISGRWLYAFLRRDSQSGQVFLVLANFHAERPMSGVRVWVPEHTRDWLGMARGPVNCSERLMDAWTQVSEIDCLEIDELPPLSARMIQLEPANG